MERYAAAHPDVKVFDPPAATMPIRHRETMLTMLEGDGWVLEVWHGQYREPDAAVHGRCTVGVCSNSTCAGVLHSR